MKLRNESKAFRVLLIEPDPKESELYADIIREVAQCNVDVMSGGKTDHESAYGWVGQSDYNLVVIDVSFVSSGGVSSGGASSGGAPSGDSSGMDLLEQVKRISPVTSVILISDSATIEQAVAAIKLGAEDYLQKPFNPEAFKLAVKRGLDRKAVFGNDSGTSEYLNLVNSCQMISASLDQKKIFEIIQSHLKRELKSAYSSIYMLEDQGVSRIDAVADDNHHDRAMQEVMYIAVEACNPLSGMVEANEFYRFIERGHLTPGLFAFRFKCAGVSDFFCVCLSPERPAAMDAFENRLRILKAQIELTGKNIGQYMGVQNLAYVDDATGLYNTRYLNYILDREIVQAESTKKSFAVLFIDADKFKTVNDSYGHLVGTKLLNELGEQLRTLVRDTDTIFRYGGDEFVAVLSPCDLQTAKGVAERIRLSVEQHVFLANECLNLHFTVSIGVALFPDHACSKKDIINAADHAMYAAKKASRNSVFMAEVARGGVNDIASETGGKVVSSEPKEGSLGGG